jgi:hypothetical protein
VRDEPSVWSACAQMEDAIQTAVAARTEAELSAELLAAARKRVEEMELEIAALQERCVDSDKDNQAMNDTLSKLQVHLNTATEEIGALGDANQDLTADNSRLASLLEDKEVGAPDRPNRCPVVLQYTPTFVHDCTRIRTRTRTRTRTHPPLHTHLCTRTSTCTHESSSSLSSLSLSNTGWAEHAPSVRVHLRQLAVSAG